MIVHNPLQFALCLQDVGNLNLQLVLKNSISYHKRKTFAWSHQEDGQTIEETWAINCNGTSFTKIVSTFKLKSIAKVISKIVQRGP
jgi:hypothetical protein